MTEIDTAVRRDVGNAQRSADAECELLPRNEVGMMLEARDHDLVASADGCVAYAVATRLSDSVVPRVKINRAASRTPTNVATRARAS